MAKNSTDVRELEAELDLVRQLLRLFAFPASPDAFQSTDGGCTEVILPDESVQQVRAYLDKTA